jgi:hypothetical protein
MKRFATALLMCLSYFVLDAQVSIEKDYFRNGSRVVELSYNGIDYSLIMQNFNQKREASLFFENIVRRKPLVMKLNERSSEVFTLTYGQDVLIRGGLKNNSLVLDEDNFEFSEEDQSDLNAFSVIFNQLAQDWPIGDRKGVSSDPMTESGTATGDDIIVAQDWQFVGITAGGALSIASARCGFMHKELDIGESCHPTTDCSCLHGSFLCICICGVICDQ